MKNRRCYKNFNKKGTKKKNITILHCNSEYPTPYKDVNLAAMQNIKKFGTEIGLSDHSLGIEVPVAAVALGANVIEKHFTLNKIHQDQTTRQVLIFWS